MYKGFEEITRVLQPVLPKGWNKICFYAELEENSYEMTYYCFINGKKKPLQCYQLVEEYQVEEYDIDNAFSKIWDILKLLWKNEKDAGKGVWTNYTLVFESTGKFLERYDYTDFSEGSYSYRKRWKERYLTQL